MRLLLDSHTFIWWDNNLSKLSPTVVALCQDSGNTLLVSIASVWEMQIKIQLGKLSLPLPLGQMIAHQQEVNNVQLLPVDITHILALDNLPMHHKDPFDRLLIVQANVENTILLSHDVIFAQYSVNVQW